MDSRKKAPSGDRRRRVLRDDGSKRRAKSSTKKKPSIELQLYTTNAITSCQPRLTELIPHRKRSLGACLIVGLGIVAAMQALFLVRRNHLAGLPPATTMPLHLMGAGTLSAWCGSLLLAFSSLVSLVIFSVRRHKVDDYRGRFGMWLTVALACMLASADASTGLHAMVNAGMTKMTGYQPFRWSGSWWAFVGGLLGIYLVVRIVVDAWRSRVTVGCTFATVAIYWISSLFFYRVLRLDSDQSDMMAHTSLLMFGHVMLAFSLLTYARSVYREAAGEIGKKKRKKRKTKVKSEKTERRSWFSRWKSDPDAKPKSKTTKKTAADVQEDDEEEEVATEGYEDVEMDELERMTDPEIDTGRPLGKNMRKRGKKQQRRAA